MERAQQTLDQFRPIVDWARAQGNAPNPSTIPGFSGGLAAQSSTDAALDDEKKAYASTMASIFSLDTLRALNRAAYLNTAGSKQVLAERLCLRAGILTGSSVRPTHPQLTYMAMLHRTKSKLPPLAAVTDKLVATEWITENGDPGCPTTIR